MGRARQIASAENMDRILLDASAASTDEGEHLLLDASASGTDVGFFLNTEVGTTETPPEGFVIESSLAANAVTNSKIVDDAVTVAKMDSTSQSLPNRNVIINGAMNVAQRGNSSTGLGADGTSYNTVDRFNFTASGTAGRFTQTHDGSAPSGFSKSLKFDCTTADTSIAAGEILLLSTLLEGQNLQRFAKGTSDAKPFAVSFYVKGNAAATYVAELYDNDNNRQVSKAFNVTTDWARVELSMGADTTGTLDNDNAVSLTFQIWLHGGSNFTSGTLNTTWGSVTQANRAAGISSFFSSTDNTFFLTGVQLEVGQNPTEFEHESFDQTLIKCQRYYQLVGRDFSDTTPTTAFTSGFTTDGSNGEGFFRFERRMRAAPTFTATTTSNLDFRTNSGSGAVHLSGNAFTSAAMSETSIYYSQQNHAGTFGGAGQPYYLRFNGVQETGLAASNQLDAEL